MFIAREPKNEIDNAATETGIKLQIGFFQKKKVLLLKIITLKLPETFDNKFALFV